MRKVQLTSLTAALLLLSVLARPEPVAALVISDGTFTDALWAATKVNDTTPGSGAVFTAGQASGGAGNPDPFRLTTHSYVDGNISVAHVYMAVSYDPSSQGAVASLDYIYDLRRFQSDIAIAPLVGVRPLLLQNGSYYVVNPSSSFSNTGWSSFASNALVASDFTLHLGAGPAIPDFTVSGAQIQFGYNTVNGDAIGGAVVPPNSITTDHGIDNWSVSITQASIPEPGTLGLLGLGIAAFGFMRRRQTA